MPREYVCVEDAIPLPGLRIAFTRGVPGPWGQAVKAIFDLKKIEYTPVIQDGGAPNEALRAWTGQNSAPCAMLADERPRVHWSELLLLAERLAPEPSLIPANEDDRTAMFGVAHELCGEDGFGWSARLLTFDVIERSNLGLTMDAMRTKFANGAPLSHAIGRINTIMASLAARIERQNGAGCPYLVGSVLSAADIYWAMFSNMLVPLDTAVCDMPDYYRDWCTSCLDMLGSPVPPALIAHRDRIVCELPQMWL